MSKRVLNYLYSAVVLSALLVSEYTQSQNVPFGFFKNQPNKIVFTTAAQSILAGNCSGITTVQYQSANNSAKLATAPMTIALTAVAGVTYYSDAYCTSVITDVTISTGSSSASYYFTSDTTGTKSLEVTWSGLMTTQNQTISTNPYVWTGGGGNALWSTNANWSGGTAPGPTHVALFNGSCSSNCSPTISTNPNVLGVRIAPTYLGTVTQNAAMTIGSKGWTQTAGTFNGSSDSISMAGTLALSGGTWVSTSGLLTLTGGTNSTNTYYLLVKTGGTFTHNSGTVKFTGGSTGFYMTPLIISSNSAWNFHHLTFDNYQSNIGQGSSYSFDQTVNVAGDLIIYPTVGLARLSSGTFNVSGNIAAYAGSTTGSATVNIIGGGTQTFAGSTTGWLPNLVINTTGSFIPAVTGGENLGAKSITLQQGAFTAPSSTLSMRGDTCTTATLFNHTGGTFSNNGGTFLVSGGSHGYCFGTYSIASTAAINFQHLQFDNYQEYYERGSIFTANQTLNVAGNFTMSASGGGSTIVNSLTANVSGNLFGLTGASGGSAIVNVIGNTTQKYTGSTTGKLPRIVVNTTGSLIPEAGTTEFGLSSLSITQGTFTAPTGTLEILGAACATSTQFSNTGGTFNHGNGTIKFSGSTSGWCSGSYSMSASAPINFNNVIFTNLDVAYAGYGSIYTSNQPLNIAGNLNISATNGVAIINSTTINLSGNHSISTGAYAGSATLNYVGSSTQTISQSGGTFFTGAVTVNQTGAGNISLGSAITAASTNWTVTAGTINMNGYNFTLQGLALGGTTINRQNGAPSPGVLTVNGASYTSGSFLGGTVN